MFYLDKTGLAYLWGKIKAALNGKLDKSGGTMNTGATIKFTTSTDDRSNEYGSSTIHNIRTNDLWAANAMSYITQDASKTNFGGFGAYGEPNTLEYFYVGAWNDCLLKIMQANGNTTVKGSLTAPTFVGKLIGNADTATKATQDGDGNNIVDTYSTKQELTDHVNKTSDSSSASALSSSDTNYPTVRDIYYGLPNINGSHAYTSGTSIYAPTSTGNTGYELISNGSGAPIWKAPSYAVCSTSASTAAKTASIANFKLVTGATVKIKFTYAHTSSSAATLNVNSTGAKTIYTHSGTSNVSVTSSHSWRAGEIVEFVYDGSYWVAVSSDQGFVEVSSVGMQNALNGKLDGSWSDANGYSNISELTLDVSDMASTVWGYLGSDNEFAGIYEVANQVSRLSTSIIVKAGESIQSAIDFLPSTGGKIILAAGTHSVTSKLTCNKNVIFEGMGAGTIINVNNHAFLYNTTSGRRIVLKNMTMNLTGTLDETYGFINAVSDLIIDNCTINSTISSCNITSVNGAKRADCIITSANVNISNSSIFIDCCYSDFHCLSFVCTPSSGKSVIVDKCNIKIYHCVSSNNTTDYSILYVNSDLYLIRDGGTISNSYIFCKGSNPNSHIKGAYACVRRCANVTNCIIDLGNQYAAIDRNSEYTRSIVNEMKFTNNTVNYYTTYCSAGNINGNTFIKNSSGSTLRLCGYSATVVTNNLFRNTAENDIVADSNVIFKNNLLRYKCTVRSSSTAIINDNLVSSVY